MAGVAPRHLSPASPPCPTKRHRPLLAGSESSRRRHRLGPFRPHPHRRAAATQPATVRTIPANDPLTGHKRSRGARRADLPRRGDAGRNFTPPRSTSTAHTGDTLPLHRAAHPADHARRPDHRNRKPAQRAGGDRLSRRLPAAGSRLAWSPRRISVQGPSTSTGRPTSIPASPATSFIAAPPAQRRRPAHLARRQAGHHLEHGATPPPSLASATLIRSAPSMYPATKASAPPRVQDQWNTPGSQPASPASPQPNP